MDDKNALFNIRSYRTINGELARMSIVVDKGLAFMIFRNSKDQFENIATVSMTKDAMKALGDALLDVAKTL